MRSCVRLARHCLTQFEQVIRLSIESWYCGIEHDARLLLRNPQMEGRRNASPIVERSKLERRVHGRTAGTMPHPSSAARTEIAMLGSATEARDLEHGGLPLNLDPIEGNPDRHGKGAGRLFLALAAMARIGWWKSPLDAIANRTALAASRMCLAHVSLAPCRLL